MGVVETITRLGSDSLNIKIVETEQQRRDKFIAAALTGLLASGDHTDRPVYEVAVQLADLTLAESEKS
jgi:hypothetical protein